LEQPNFAHSGVWKVNNKFVVGFERVWPEKIARNLLFGSDRIESAGTAPRPCVLISFFMQVASLTIPSEISLSGLNCGASRILGKVDFECRLKFRQLSVRGHRSPFLEASTS